VSEQGPSRVPPSALDSEAQLIGACLLVRHALEETIDAVSVADFYKPGHARIWETLVALYDDGVTADAVLVADHLKRRGQLDEIGGTKTLVKLEAQVVATSLASKHAQRIADAAGKRRILAMGIELVNRAIGDDVEMSSLDLIDWAHRELDGVEVGVGEVPESFLTIEEFLDRPDEARGPWVIPGQMRRGWRAVVVAGEGVGKSTLLKQIAICASQGLHPMVPGEAIEPIRALIVDLENPDEAIDEQIQLILPKVWRALPDENWRPENLAMLKERGGLNLRRRRDRGTLEAVLAHFQPDLVVAGPAYKMYEKDSGERGHEDGVTEIMATWIKLIERYGFALMIEHHAPMASGDRGRTIRPADTMMWLRWPEFGISLTKSRKKDDPPETYTFGRHRGDRVKAVWPLKMLKGTDDRDMPWTFRWPDGTFSGGGMSVDGPAAGYSEPLKQPEEPF